MNESDTTPATQSRTTPWWKLAFELLALGVGICVAVIYYGQLKQMIESNRISRESLVAAQRAFITSSGIKKKVIELNTAAGVERKAFEFTTQWENVGNTPAIGVVMMVGTAEKGDELTEAEFMSTAMSTAVLKSPRSAIGPKSTVDSAVTRQPEAFATENPEVPRFFWGWLVYRDVFPNTKPHVTEFCLKTTKIHQRSAEYSFDATVCPHHNCVDEFCEDYATITSLMSPNN